MEHSFDSLNIKDEILRGVYSYGFEKPSQIQAQLDPSSHIGQRYCGTSPIGYRKNGCSRSILSRIDEDEKHTQLLLLTPTRELADQIYQVVKEISRYTKIKCVMCVGGTNVGICRDDLSANPHVVIATPGPSDDMIEKRSFKQHPSRRQSWMKAD